MRILPKMMVPYARWRDDRFYPIHEIEGERSRTSRTAAHLDEVVSDRKVNELFVGDPSGARPHLGLVLSPPIQEETISRLDRRDPERTMSQS